MKGKTKEKIEDIKAKELEAAIQQIEDGIKNMSKQDISNMLDEMIGMILTLIELAGFVTGALFGFLLAA